MKPTVSISILTYNRSLLVSDLLASLRLIRFRPLEIIVVDNHSSDDTEKVVRGIDPRVTYIRTERNLGVGARNLGMSAAKGDIIITLDDDVFGLKDGDIESIRRMFSESPDLGAINFKVVDPVEGKLCNWVHHCDSEKYSDKEFLTYEITEGAVAFRKEALELAGYYPDMFFLSHEGPDLAFRMLESGFRVAYSGKIAVTHCAASEGRSSWRNYYFDTRNQLWLAARNMPLSYLSLYLLRGLSAMFIYSVRDGYLRYWMKAIFDGLKGLPEVIKQRKVLSKSTMKVIRCIDSNRPNIFRLIKSRIFRKKPIHILSS